jgi:hypothetical protein
MWKNKLFFVFISLTVLFLFSTCNSNNEVVNTNPLTHYTLTLQPDSSVGKDTFITYYYPDANWGNYGFIYPKCWTVNSYSDIIRVLIQFDLSTIPNDASIDSAFISFYFALDPVYIPYDITGDYGNNSMLLQRVIGPWDEPTVTWKNQPNIDTKHTVWIDKFTNPQQDYKDIDVTLLVKDILTSNKNYGFMLRMADETPYKITFFASSDYPDASKHPKLVVYYTK